MRQIIRILIESPHYFGMKTIKRLNLVKFLLINYDKIVQEELKNGEIYMGSGFPRNFRPRHVF